MRSCAPWTVESHGLRAHVRQCDDVRLIVVQGTSGYVWTVKAGYVLGEGSYRFFKRGTSKTIAAAKAAAGRTASRLTRNLRAAGF